MVKYKYIRNIKLTITTEKATYDFSKFQVVFQVVHGSITAPKILKCRIFNLSHGGRGSKNTIGDIQHARNKKIVLETWYNGETPAVLFEGQIRMIYAGRDSPVETYLEIEASVCEDIFATGGYNVVLPKGWTYESAIKQTLGKTQGMSVGTIPQSNGSGSRAKVIYGNTRDIIRQHARNLSAFPVLQDTGRIDFMPAQNPKGNGEIIKLTPFNGMIGTPVQVPEGIQVTALINPAFKLGAVIDVYSLNGDDSRTAVEQEEVELQYTGINSGNQYINQYGNLEVKGLAHNGLYTILFVDHNGQTRGEAWYSTIIGQALDPSDQSISTNKAISAMGG